MDGWVFCVYLGGSLYAFVHVRVNLVHFKILTEIVPTEEKTRVQLSSQVKHIIVKLLYKVRLCKIVMSITKVVDNQRLLKRQY